jgi:ribonuclease HI
MILVHTDGASKGNPGPSGAGIYIKADKTYEYAIPLGILSNHEAEFHAVIQALDICLNKFPNEILSIQTDSQVVVDVIEKEFTKNIQYQALLKIILEKMGRFPYVFVKWIPNKQNPHADRLAKKAIHLN